MVVQNFGTMGQGCRPRRWRDGVQTGPQRFQNLTGADRGAGNKRTNEPIEAIVLVAMHVEVVDCPLNGQTGRQFVSDPVDQVDNVLTYNVIYEHDSLLRRDADDLQATNQSEVDIFLLFAFQQINKGIRHKATMPGTTYCSDAGDIAGLGGK
jgi:hypothetical protein